LEKKAAGEIGGGLLKKGFFKSRLFEIERLFVHQAPRR